MAKTSTGIYVNTLSFFKLHTQNLWYKETWTSSTPQYILFFGNLLVFFMLYESKGKINIMKMSHIVLPPVFALNFFASHYLIIFGDLIGLDMEKKTYPHLAWWTNRTKGT